ncbi:helix-turn-helix domain-containing protein [Streptomyces sp. NBC_00825]|uniref:helix-turn-helix domain-containing protein n=1 Tax=unclassified Streptomyces TaxID=2593676 RepID=UPI00225BBCF8|nr:MULTISPECIES: helix-turn-helix transcriptional regulator [unclassified Streptomyces]WTB57329.1 helix-turn-helix domain-containing protein [Streptomyces sp. NBC_00826]WTH95530.1 helix-turn-helix domain-containing protein [Streptomyces sp. NBC_00825]WTI04258.1 helix-turn-helix domain-containing protein [Streptomyces sp. NBC_00822]MCX4863892.1 helix-turn-helix domain-containing protein [Streptomyces sp. NBC_00906]MCX4895130.1 helix-turn-helix domain-containing protein [Streptomyces sp. NBC_008
MPQRRVISGRSQEPRQRFAEELRILRTGSGTSLRQLGERLGWDWSLFGKMEKGETLGSPEVVQALDTHYGTPGLLLALWELAAGDKSQFRERYRRYMTLEAEAVSLWHFAVSVLPGLLQTPGYAREVLAAGGSRGKELEQQVEARMGRKDLLAGEDAPPFRTILSEAVLRTPLRDTGEWLAQLEYVADVAERPNVTLHVLPQSAGMHGLDSTALMFLRLHGGRTVAYTENAHRGELIEESASVERLTRAYDAMRDLALSPAESRKFVLAMLEEVPCDASI